MIQRIIICVISIICLVTVVILYVGGGLEAINRFWPSVLLRLGVVLLTIFLAWPNLIKLAPRMPEIVIGTLLVALAFFVFRPRLLPLIAGFVVIVFIIHFGFRLISRGKSPSKKPSKPVVDKPGNQQKS